jgi:hypothetical protein
MERRAKDGTYYTKVGQDDWAPVTRKAKDGSVFRKVGDDSWEPLAKSMRTSDALDTLTEGGSQKPEASMGEQALRMGLGALPAVGGIIGGIAGTVVGAPTGPGAIATGVGGAALGTAAGESYKQLGENYFFGEKRQPMEAAKSIGMAAGEGAVAQLAGNAVGKVGGAIVKTAPVQGAIRSAGSGLAKVGEALTGVSKKSIETYAKHAPEISKMSKAAGGDVQVAADTLRTQFNKAIQGTRQTLNAQLEQGLKAGSDAGKSINPHAIVEALEASKSKINAKLNPEYIEQVDDVIKKVAAVTDESGKIPLKDAHDLKGYLQDLASGAYSKGGQIFQVGKPVAQASKSGAAIARRAVNTEASEIAAANNKLSNLHNIERGMNRNMLKEGETASSLLGAGAGTNPKNAQHLKRLSAATGSDMLAEAEKLNAMKTFGEAPVMPLDFTGKAVGRMATGYGVGYAIGGDHTSGMTGAALTSPLAMKGAIRAGRGVMHAGNALSRGAAQQLVGQAAVGRAPSIPRRDAPPMVERGAGEMVAENPLKGPDKWAADGFVKLQQHDKNLNIDSEKLKSTPAGKRLLVAASDLKPGTPAMSKVLEQIKKLEKGG